MNFLWIPGGYDEKDSQGQGTEDWYGYDQSYRHGLLRVDPVVARQAFVVWNRKYDV
jgi:hypothetical protein